MKRIFALLMALCLLLPAAMAEESRLLAQARTDLTEVLGYTAEEAARFVFEDREEADGTVRFWPADHPDWVYTESRGADGMIRGATPFDTGFSYACGENLTRELLRQAREKGWFAHWDADALAAVLDVLREHERGRAATDLLLAQTGAQAVDALLETCYGPRARWTAAVHGLRDETLAENGLTAEETPFHTPGVRSYTGRDLSSIATTRVTLFEGEAPEDLKEALSDPHLAGWRLQSGAAVFHDWQGLEILAPYSGAGLAAFEKDGRRQLVQLVVRDEGWQVFPLGEKALRQTGDYRVTYDGMHLRFVVEYLLDGDETLRFYLSPTTGNPGGEFQAYCRIDAGERVNRRTGAAEWISLNGYATPTWKEEEQSPDGRPVAVSFMPFLGIWDIADFPVSPEAGQASRLPENTVVTIGAVNFRSRTSSRSKSYGQLMGGVMLPVLEEVPGDPLPWIHTRLGAYDGYVVWNYVDDVNGYLNINAPQPVARANSEISLKKGTGWLAGTAATLPAGTKMHVVMEDGGWLYVCVPRGEWTDSMDLNGVFGWLKKDDVTTAAMPCQLDWTE